MTDQKILIIEDDNDFAKLISKGLSRGLPSVETIVVNDGVDGIQKVEFEAYDLIITDIQLPRKDGESLLKRVKFSPLNKSTPVIVVSGFANENLTRNFAPLFLLEKPFRVSELVSVAKSLLALKKDKLEINHSGFQALIDSTEKALSAGNIKINKVGQPWVKRSAKLPCEHINLYFDLSIDDNRASFALSLKQGTFKTLCRKLKSSKEYLEEGDTDLMAEELLKLVSYQMSQYFERTSHEQISFHTKQRIFDDSGINDIKAPKPKSIGVYIETSIGDIEVRSFVAPSKGLIAA